MDDIGQHAGYRRLCRFLRPFTARITLLVGLVALQSVLAVAPALVGQHLIDDGVLRRDTGTVRSLGGVLVLLGLAQAVVAFAQMWFATRLAEDIVMRLRIDLFAHLRRQSLGFFMAARRGAIVSRLHGDVLGMQRLISQTLPAAVGALVTLATAGSGIVTVNWRLALIALCLVPMVGLVTSSFSRTLRSTSQRQLQVQADMDALVAERFSPGGAEVGCYYGHAGLDTSHFRARAGRVRDVAVRRALLSAGLAGSLTLIIGITAAATYVLAGQWVISGAMSVGTMVASVALLAMLHGPLTALSGVKVDLVAGMVGFARVQEVLDFAPPIADEPGARALPQRGGRAPVVTFSHVDFTYPPRSGLVVPSLAVGDEGAGDEGGKHESRPAPLLRAVDFTAAPGTTVGIVGLSGAGKSTLIKLLTRTWDVDAGQVLIDGVDVRKLRLAELRAIIGVVTQETFMFNDTIRNNLRLARPDADEDELVEACRTAQIWDLIESLPDALDTVVGDQGLRLSGGERQRLAIARLLLKRPQVVVLDEATSHADNVTERAVRNALRPFLRTRTCLVIAHRLSTVRDADLILVMRNGHVVERGRHEELAQAGGCYASLHQAQQGIAPTAP
ncbi:MULTISPECIES: ABC transporter ATP-binding protein [unclassified Streptomyces]|uniref:ABC transporter ATP-binding protein n=1 Tax=unclassified Streptomyces TaxID=2593676 RepID=UPI003369E762